MTIEPSRKHMQLSAEAVAGASAGDTMAATAAVA